MTFLTIKEILAKISHDARLPFYANDWLTIKPVEPVPVYIEYVGGADNDLHDVHLLTGKVSYINYGLYAIVLSSDSGFVNSRARPEYNHMIQFADPNTTNHSNWRYYVIKVETQ